MSRRPALKLLNRWSRKAHRFGTIVIALPLLLVISTGILLQLKKHVAWVQPPTATGTPGPPALSFEEILEGARTVEEAEIDSWEDILLLDVRPGKGIVKVRAKNRWEVQLDTKRGQVVQVAYRRSDLIESLHDGSFFHEAARLWVFLPSGLVLLGLWFTGLYLWALPIWAKAAGQRRRALQDAKTRTTPPK